MDIPKSMDGNKAQEGRKTNRIDAETRVKFISWYGTNKDFLVDAEAPWHLHDLAALATIELGTLITFSNVEGVFEFLGVQYPHRDRRPIYEHDFIKYVAKCRSKALAAQTYDSWLRNHQPIKADVLTHPLAVTPQSQANSVAAELAKVENRFVVLEAAYRSMVGEVATLREQLNVSEKKRGQLNDEVGRLHNKLLRYEGVPDALAALQLNVETLLNRCIETPAQPVGEPANG